MRMGFKNNLSYNPSFNILYHLYIHIYTFITCYNYFSMVCVILLREWFSKYKIVIYHHFTSNTVKTHLNISPLKQLKNVIVSLIIQSIDLAVESILQSL